LWFPRPRRPQTSRTTRRASQPATPDRTPPFVGLTGSIGAGKSTALAALERLGAAGLSADAVVHELYETEAVQTALRLRWGDGVFSDDGGAAQSGAARNVDRQAVARIIFNSDDQRAWLQGLLWPLTARRTEDFREALARLDPPPRAGVVETPLLFEAGAEQRFDVTIAIVAGDDLRRQRLALRDQAELAARERLQLSQEEKAARANFAVSNDGTIEELERKLAEILDSLEV
jgi:dephospho-CoA kinase